VAACLPNGNGGRDWACIFMRGTGAEALAKNAPAYEAGVHDGFDRGHRWAGGMPLSRRMRWWEIFPLKILIDELKSLGAVLPGFSFT